MTAVPFQPSNIDWHHVNVLIIDDQRSSGQLIKTILHSINITNIDIATNSVSALQLCQTTAYDLILIDFHLDPHVSGSELLTVMRKNNHISSHCGIIFISGDRTPEVIVTSMSMDADSFLSKPLNIGMLKQRIMTVYQACLLRKPIYTAIDNDQIPDAITLCRQLLQQYGHNIDIEILLLDLLIEQQAWSQAQSLLTIFSQHSNNHKLRLRQARLVQLQGDILSATLLLQTLIKQVPLFIEAYDELASLLHQQHQDNEAKIIANQALMLTPSISHRSLLVAKLAVNTNDPSLFIKTGKILVTHLPIIDNDWLIHLAQFTALFEQLYSQQSSSPPQKKLLKQLKQLQQQARQRLSRKQQLILTAFRHITLARFSAIEQQPLKAKRRLFYGLKMYFGQMSQAPTAIMVDALPLLIHFGETYLIREIYQALMSQDKLDQHSRQRIIELQSNDVIIENIRLLIAQLAMAKTTINQDPQQAYCLYQTILHDCPHNTEAHLGRINCLLSMQQGHHPDISNSLHQVNKMPLPSPLSEWFTQIQQQRKDEKTIING